MCTRHEAFNTRSTAEQNSSVVGELNFSILRNNIWLSELGPLVLSRVNCQTIPVCSNVVEHLLLACQYQVHRDRILSPGAPLDVPASRAMGLLYSKKNWGWSTQWYTSKILRLGKVVTFQLWQMRPTSIMILKIILIY